MGQTGGLGLDSCNKGIRGIEGGGGSRGEKKMDLLEHSK